MKELEVKVLNVDLEEMEKKLIELGAKLISREIQVNTLIDSKELYIQKDLDSYMRIRETRSLLDNDSKFTLTMKRNIKREGIRENKEINIDISDKKAMLEVLDLLGFRVSHEGFKERTSYQLGNIRFDLDKWDEKTYPKPYMEIEVEQKDELEEAIKLLGLSRDNISTKSIVELQEELKL